MRLLRTFLVVATLCGWGSLGSASAPWRDAAWPRRIELVANPAQIAGSETFGEFTLLLRLNGTDHASVFTHAKADGSDLVVTAGDGNTVLSHEIVSFDPIGQSAEIWFKAPALSDVANRFYLYFGNAGATIVPTPGAAWTGQHLAVYHFAENPTLGILEDYGPQENDASTPTPTNWISGDVVPGQIGSGWWFDGQNNFVDGDQISSNTGIYTISGWFAVYNLEVDANFAFGAEVGFWHISMKRHGGQRVPDLVTDDGFMIWPPVLSDSDMHHFVWTLDAAADTARFYFDGVEKAPTLVYAPNPPFKSFTGVVIQGDVGICGPLFEGNPLDLFEGVADEFRVYEGLRNPAWVQTEYNNQKDPTAFYTYLEQTTSTVSTLPISGSRLRISAAPNPLREQTEITIEGARGDVEIAVYDIAGRHIRSLRSPRAADGPVRLFWDGRDDAGQGVGSGIYYLRAVGEGSPAGTKLVLMR